MFQQRNYYIKINHMLVLQAILQHCGVTGDQLSDVLHILSGAKLDSHYRNISKSLTSLGLSDQTVSTLLGILEMEGNYGKVASYLRCITKTRGEVRCCDCILNWMFYARSYCRSHYSHASVL